MLTPPRFGTPLKRGTWLLLGVLSLLPTLSMLLRMMLGRGWNDAVIAWVAFLSLAFLSLVFSLVVIRDVLWSVMAMAQTAASRIRKTFSSDTPASLLAPDSSRRQFLVSSLNVGLVGLSGVLMGYGVNEAHKRPDVVRVDIPLDNTPPDLEGFRIVQISDLHVGAMLKRDWVSMIVDTVNELSPDMIAITGDLIDGRAEALHSDVAPLANLSARHGSFFVTGNHEYYSGVADWITEARQLGVVVLLNEHEIVQHGDARILLGGVTDHSAHRFGPAHVSNPSASLSGAPRSDVKILLAHQPRSIFEASRIGYDLQVCGHTHGGQFFPWSYVVHLIQPYVSGLHMHNGTWVYVNRGTGYWGPPVRIGQPPEITEIVLT